MTGEEEEGLKGAHGACLNQSGVREEGRQLNRAFASRVLDNHDSRGRHLHHQGNARFADLEFTLARSEETPCQPNDFC